MVAPFFGTVFLVTLREARVPLFIQTLRKEQQGMTFVERRLFISIFYSHQILSIFKPDEVFPWINKDYLFIYYHGHMYTFINIAPFISRI